MNIVYLDLLGTKKKWEKGGRIAVEAAFDRFEQAVYRGLAQVGGAGIREGGIEGDSAAFVCLDPLEALRLTQAIFSYAFSTPNPEDELNRIWIRGSIVAASTGAPLRTAAPMPGPMGHLSTYRFSPEFLDAISVERSGFKGMRVLVDDRLVTELVRAAVRIPVRGRNLIPLKRLTHSDYRVPGYQDWLWMLPADDAAWQRLRLEMATRLRWSSRDADEFVHAAATQVVFNECDAILASITFRA